MECWPLSLEHLLGSLVMLDQRSEISANVMGNVQPDQVEEAEGCCFGSTDGWTGDRIDFSDGVVILQYVLHCISTGNREDSIANEVGSILAHHDTLAQLDFAQVGDEVEVMVLDIDPERRRISLGMKQCSTNPWEAFAATHNKNDKVSGKIKSITDFGIFVGLDGGIDGLVHLSDLSWDSTGEDLVQNYAKGDELEAVVLSIDPERERISLGVKQMEQDPFSNFVAANGKGALVKGTITEVDAKAAIIDLGDGVEGTLRASELSRDRVEDARSLLKEGEEIEAKFIGVDRKTRTINLSIKAKDADDEAQAIKDYASDSSGASTSLGDLLKEQMDANND